MSRVTFKGVGVFSVKVIFKAWRVFSVKGMAGV